MKIIAKFSDGEKYILKKEYIELTLTKIKGE